MSVEEGNEDLATMLGKGIKIKLGGKEWTIRAIQMDQLAELKQQLKAERINATVIAMESNTTLEPARKDVLIARAMAAPVTLHDLIVAAESDPEMQIRIMHSMFLRDHPGVTLEQFMTVLKNATPEEVATARLAFKALSGGTADVEPDPTTATAPTTGPLSAPG